MYVTFGKRLLDLTLVMLSAPVWLPILAITALIVKTKIGSPVFFRQQRAGKDGEPFFMVKFRTMTDERDSDGALLPDESRLHNIGMRLRSMSLDELPGLFQVITGQLSLVGPRPLYMEYVPLYSETQKERLSVRPGITGWAQVNGRNAISWKRKFEFDVFYVENLSFALDMKILLLTVLKVFRQADINASDHATMKRFEGNADAE